MKTQEVQFGGNNYPCRVVESNAEKGQPGMVRIKKTIIILKIAQLWKKSM